MFRILLPLCAALIFASGQRVYGDDVIEPAPAEMLLSIDQLDDAPLQSSRPEPQTTTRGISIESGLVVINGQVLKSPYVVSRSDGNVLINDVLIADQQSPHGHDRQFAANIERELLSDNWILVFDGGVVAFTDAEVGITLIGNLSQAGSMSDQIELAMITTMVGTEHVTTAEWTTAFRNFKPDESILERFHEFQNEMYGMGDPVEDQSKSDLKVHDSTRTMYGLSVVGMLLIALSAGTLLGNPPKNSLSWSRIVSSPRTLTAMQRCLLLIAAYSLFDLVATVMALKTGHVEELNPLGVGLILAPAALAAFKVSATCLGTGLLWRLKNYHGAQVASWWLCMILTLVTVRWVTVQSLFFV